MKSVIIFSIILTLINSQFSQTNNKTHLDHSQNEESAMQQILIDKFIVPEEAKEKFLKRLDINMKLLGGLPGLVETAAFEQTKGEGNFNYVTVAVWENEEALAKAKKAVNAEYQKQGFDPQEMFERLNITIDRAVYTKKMGVNPAGKNKEIVRKLYEDCLNKRNYDLLKTLISEDYEGPSGETGHEGFKATVESVINAFPDIGWKIEDSIAEKDKVVIRTSWHGTHKENFRGLLKATQKEVTNTAITIYRLKDEKIIRAWIITDRLGFLQQLGAVPRDLNSLSTINEKE